MQKKHLDQARERGAKVLDFGDAYCAMQGRYDKRSDKSDIRPEHQSGNYLDRLVTTGADWFGDYADILLQFSMGNHESSILKHHETNLVERLVERINATRNSQIMSSGFSGWVRFMFTTKKTERTSRKLAWHHGYGGDAPVTKGVIQTNRMAVYLPDADIVVTGHTHNEWQFPIPRVRLSDSGQVFHDEQLHLKIPGYKEEYEDGHGGWHIERGGPPKPIGAVWLRFYYENSAPGKIATEVTRAK